jgi:hypothetical protein
MMNSDNNNNKKKIKQTVARGNVFKTANLDLFVIIIIIIIIIIITIIHL